MATKSNIITKVAKRHPLLDKVVIAAIVNRFFEVLSSALEHHNRVEIRGFGSFSIRSYNLKETNHLVLQQFAKNQYFKTYFRSSKKLSDLINE
ncbi:integration host factor subunit beta [Wolbachia endosymbiont of Atemnus politus]|uniref:HU family DNA-binding protein n=1 Tax=Wolbachia endosymbiont of Atemnus politus TaxID=2682840 RepID=UPI001572A3CF|nr:HU family DNA-binding protein [Wolbachia endosymbiont of Atemnus politus]NSM56468.1 integration host factor subunit beta [Wolbachia endosymbiont of Atemnus politus]NSX82985.1 integration host factor subunit beta [Wolbachia endosymbiont of Atemnus politus]